MKAQHLLIAGLLASGPFASIAGSPDLTRDNAALIRHIKTTDDVFVRVLGACSSEILTRNKVGFTYRANCQIKPLPETDCQRYLVVATGTVDTKAWATVRGVHLSLQCAA